MREKSNLLSYLDPRHMIFREYFYHPYLQLKQVRNPSGCDEMALNLKSYYLWRRK